jgi:glyoxylase-like metal-dependent hydrolase (beta-lactamase superfamily II)
MTHSEITLDGTTVVHSFADTQSSHLVVRGDNALLVDCHRDDMPAVLRAEGLPQPSLILHTHVQPEHCREGDAFGAVPIRVPAGEELLASDPDGFAAAAATVWDDPDDWGNSMGEEPYGVGGCPLYRPPAVPLVCAPPLVPGEQLSWAGLVLDILHLPAHGKRSVGLLLRDGDTTLGLFSGDLIVAPGVLADIASTQFNYGATFLASLPGLLHDVAALGDMPYFPATGPVLPAGAGAARALATKVEAYLAALPWRTGTFQPTPLPASEQTLGRFDRVADGIYQINTFGNSIVFIDEDGRGMVVDPGPCDYEFAMPERVVRQADDFAALEQGAGLQTVDRILITHFHGDHIDLIPGLLERYPAARVATLDHVADVVTRPHDFPYSCRLPWYNLGFDTVPVHDRMRVGDRFRWHDVEIEVLHLPGHCYAHAGFVFDFRGQRVAVTGDTIQNRGTASGLDFIISNHSAPGRQGNLAAFRNVNRHRVDLNLGGHGSRFLAPNALYEESIARIEKAMPLLAALVPDGDLERACIPPHFPQVPMLSALD